jgi:hypothetical protein
MKIQLHNDFHNTNVNIIVSEPNRYGDYKLSDSQVRRIRKALCGMSDCGCGTVRDSRWSLNDCPGQVATLEPR